MTGAGAKFKENALRLQKLDPSYDNALGYTLEGCFYAVAPWPLKNFDKAMGLLKKAVDTAPGSRRNHYHLAVCSYLVGDFQLAAKESRATLDSRPTGNDIDFADFMAEEAERVHALAMEKVLKEVDFSADKKKRG